MGSSSSGRLPLGRRPHPHPVPGRGRSELGLVARFGVAGPHFVAVAALAAVAVVGHVGQGVGADQVPAGHSLVTPMGTPPLPHQHQGAVQPLKRDLAHPQGWETWGCAMGLCSAIKSYFSFCCTAAKAKGKPSH